MKLYTVQILILSKATYTMLGAWASTVLASTPHIAVTDTLVRMQTMFASGGSVLYLPNLVLEVDMRQVTAAYAFYAAASVQELAAAGIELEARYGQTCPICGGEHQYDVCPEHQAYAMYLRAAARFSQTPEQPSTQPPVQSHAQPPAQPTPTPTPSSAPAPAAQPRHPSDLPAVFRTFLNSLDSPRDSPLDSPLDSSPDDASDLPRE